MSKLFRPTEDYKEIISRLGEEHFNIIKSIDGKSTVIELAKISSISLPEMKKILNLLLMKGYIDILPEELKWILILEKLYILYMKSIKKLMGKRSIKDFLNVLENEGNPMIKFIIFSDDNIPSFEAIKKHIEGHKDVSIRELQELFSSPLLKYFDILKKDVGTKLVNKIKNRIFEELESFFGSKIVRKLEKILV